jgi:hypothetical protein
MRHKITIGLVLVSLLVLAIAPMSQAQYGSFVMSVGINLVNLDPANAAAITIDFYPVGTGAAISVPDTIPAGGAAKYFPIPTGDGFNGSAVVSSDREIAAIVNEISSGYGGSYNGFSAGSTSFYAPIIMRNNGGYNTEISVQNTGSGTASVSISFVAGNFGTDYAMPAFNVEPNRAVRVYQGDQTQLGTRFVGSASITSNQPVVVVVNQINNTNRTLLVYSGFAAGYNRVAVPQVQHLNSNYNTGIQVQNVDPSRTAHVQVAYSANVAPGATAFTPGTESAAVAPGETAVFNQWGNSHGYNWDAAPRYVGSAIVSTTEGDIPLVVNVNVLKGTAPAQAAAYEGINADSTATHLATPIIMSNNGGFSSSCLVLNPSSSASVNVTMSFTPNTAITSEAKGDESFSLGPGQSNQFRQFVNNAVNNWNTRWVGSGEITASGPVAVVCNQLNFTATNSDGLMSYIAFPLD